MHKIKNPVAVDFSLGEKNHKTNTCFELACCVNNNDNMWLVLSLIPVSAPLYAVSLHF